MTFSPEAANERSDTLRLLTFGDAMFGDLLKEVKSAAPKSFWCNTCGGSASGIGRGLAGIGIWTENLSPLRGCRI